MGAERRRGEGWGKGPLCWPQTSSRPLSYKALARAHRQTSQHPWIAVSARCRSAARKERSRNGSQATEQHHKDSRGQQLVTTPFPVPSFGSQASCGAAPGKQIQLPRHHTRRLDRGFEVWVMMCAPEERLDAAPTGHGVGVEDAESDREDCERRQGVGTGGPTADTRDTLRPQSMRPQDRRIRGRSCAVLEAHNCPRSSMGWTGWFRRESTGKSHCKTVTQAVTTHTNMTRNRVTGKHRVG